MDKFLETYRLPTLDHDANRKSERTDSKETKAVIISLPTKKLRIR